MLDKVMGQTLFWSMQTNKQKHTQTHKDGETLYALPLKWQKNIAVFPHTIISDIHDSRAVIFVDFLMG